MATIDTTILEQKEAEITKQFDSIQSQIRGIELQERTLGQNKKELNVELFRLQGEHRLLKSLQEPVPETAEAPSE